MQCVSCTKLYLGKGITSFSFPPLPLTITCLPVPHFPFESRWRDVVCLLLSRCCMSPSSQGDIGLARAMSCWALGQSLGVAGGFLRRISPCRHCVDYSVLFCLLRDVHLVAYTIYIISLLICLVWMSCLQACNHLAPLKSFKDPYF